MKNMRVYVKALFCCALVHLCMAQGAEKYIQKNHIDTLIQRAFYELSAASDGMPGSDMRRLIAIAEAKKIAARLKREGRGDPNERYILWKTGELENQILLEENDIILERLYKIQKEKNKIVDIFNEHIGKKRPDFTILKKAVEDMAALDKMKGLELETSFEQRLANISKETAYMLGKAIQASDAFKIQSEFEYCRNNRHFLLFAPGEFDKFEQRFAAIGEAIKQKPVIDELLLSAQNRLQHNEYGLFWKSKSDAESIILRTEKDLPAENRAAYSASIKKLVETANRCEDSLVALSFSISGKRGPDAAIDYIDKVLRPMGITEPKLGVAASSIMKTRFPENKTENAAVCAEMKAIADQGAPEGVDFDNVKDRAKKKAKEHADSLKMLQK